ncbi:cytochrome P450 [Phlebopus sp. FC_14]|nr:cytochrome P450 [Phlebopus sp. FC_14]
MDHGLLALFVVLSTSALGYSLWSKKGTRTRSPLPPGPPSLPILGNVLDIPSSEPWIAYDKWAKKYGDVFRIRLLTRDAIVLNSLESAKALLEQRSQIYSSRPYLATNEILGAEWNTAFLPYCDRWRSQRKVFQKPLRPEGAALYRPMQLKRARELVKNMLDAPLEYREHFQTFATSIIMSATYGYHPAVRNDPVVAKIQTVTHTFGTVVTPELSAVFSAFPWLRYIPSWFPGATFQRTASSFRSTVSWWLDAPFEDALTKMSRGSLGSCVVRDALARINEDDVNAREAKQAIKEAAATLFAGEPDVTHHIPMNHSEMSILPPAASDTTASVLLIFMLAMTLYPDVQKRAQQEIETVVGSDRLPNFSDRPRMPYVEALLRETLRWHPVAPLSLPHCNVADDVYQGYVIPKGTTIIPNLWAMAHDETKYSDPCSFNPSRFFDDNGELNQDTVSYGFGFGRRVCIGRYLADASLWSAISHLLAAFVFRGQDGPPVPRFTMGVTSEPEPFKVVILPRYHGEKLAGLLSLDVEE